MNKKIIEFKYKNYKNEISWRRVEPISIEFKSTEYHPQEQWILNGIDQDKMAERSFAVIDIIEFKKENN